MLLDVTLAREVHFGLYTQAHAEIVRHRNLKCERRQHSARNLFAQYLDEQDAELYANVSVWHEETLAELARNEENFIARCINRANQLGKVAVWDYDYEEDEECISYVNPDSYWARGLIGEPGAFAALKS